MQTEFNKGRTAWKSVVATIALVSVISSGAWVLTDTGNPAVEPAFRIEAALPSDCLVHLSYDGVNAAKNCRNLALARLWEEPQMRHFMKPAMAMMSDMSGELEQQLGEMGFTVQDLEALAQGRLTTTLVDLEMPTGNGPPIFDVVITIDLDSNQELVGRLSQFVAGMVENQLGVAPTQVDINGHTGIQVDLDGVPVTWAAAGGHLIAGTQVGTLGSVLDRVKAGAGTGGLIENADFSTAMKSCAPYGHVGWAYVNLRRGLALLQDSPAADDGDFQQFMGIMNLLGIDSFGAMAYGLGFEGRAIVERFHITMPDGPKGLYQHMPMANGELRTSSMAPRDSFLYEGFLIDLHGMAKTGMEALASFDQGMSDEVNREMGKVEDQLGFSFMDDLLPSFGHEMAIWVGRAPFGGMVPEIMFAAELKDRAKFDSCIDKTIAAYGEDAAIHEFAFMNHKIGYADIGALIPQRDPVGFGLKPCWMVDGDFLLLALAPQTLKHYLAAQGSQRPGVATHPDYVEGLTHIRQTNPQAGTSSAVFINMGEAMAFAIDTAAPIMQSMHFPDDVPVDMTQFPTTDVFRRHLFGLTATGCYTNSEMKSELYSCTGYMPALAIVGGAIGFGVARAGSAAPEWEEWEDEEGK